MTSRQPFCSQPPAARGTPLPQITRQLNELLDDYGASELEHAITEALRGAQEILVVGPAQAKLQLIKHIHARAADMVKNIVGVETVDHPTDGQLVAYARKYFVAKDRMLP